MGFPTDSRRHAAVLVCLALAITLLDAIKPLTIDDSAYYYYAAHIAERPLDPYGFQVFWWYQPQPANEVLAPPLLPYWWALGIRLFGDAPFLWKLWLLPFSLLFVGALNALARRFARGMELPLVAMTVLSPAFLPGLNLMLDVPALSLSLASLVAFFRGCDRSSAWRVVFAGALAGLAMQTKYTAFLAPVTMLLYAVVVCPRAILPAVAAVAVAATVFIEWEAFVTEKYGQSHFLYHLSQSRGDEPLHATLLAKLRWFGFPLLILLGAVAPTLGLLGLAALGRSSRTLLEAAGLMVLAYLLVAGFGSATIPAALHDAVLSRFVLWDDPLSLEQAAFLVLGIGTCLGVCLTGGRACEPNWTDLLRREYWWSHREPWFLVLWLGLEVAGYFALTPFAAVRRVLGIIVVSTLLVGYLAAQTCQTPERRRWIHATVLGSAGLGLLFAGVDLRDAWAEKELAEGAARVVRASRGPGTGRVWYVGHWGFQHYAERVGMVPVVPGQTELRPGDWLVVPDPRVTQQMLDLREPLEKGRLEAVGPPLAVGDLLPLRTIMGYYGTATGVPLQHLDGPRVTATVYRVKHAFVASPV
jgi:hypothetical protein